MPDGPDRVREAWAAVGEFFEQCPVSGVIVRSCSRRRRSECRGRRECTRPGQRQGRCRSAALGQNRPQRSDAIGLGRHHRGPNPGCERARPHVLGGLRARRGDRCRCSVFFPARPRNRICWLARNPRPLRLSCTKASLLGLRRWPTAGSSLRGMAQTRMSPGSPRLTAAIIYQSLDAPLECDSRHRAGFR